MTDKDDNVGIYLVKDDKQDDKKLTKVDPKTFAKMKTDQGPSVSDLTKQGLKVVLFFMRALGCPFCLGTLEDIYALQDPLWKMGAVVIIMYQEKTDTWNDYIKENPKFDIFYYMSQAPYKKEFGITYDTIVSHLAPAKFIEYLQTKTTLATYGIKPWSRSANEVSWQNKVQLAAIFVVHDDKIISESRKESGVDRFDLARVVIDPDGFGIQVHTSIFQCERPKKNKIDEKLKVEIKRETKPVIKNSSCITPNVPEDVSIRYDISLSETLNNPVYRGYLRVHMTKDYCIETLFFWEEVVLYKQLSEEDRKIRSKKICDTFINENSEYEINTSAKIRSMAKEGVEVSHVDLFDVAIKDLENNVFGSIWSQFQMSDLYVAMQRKDNNKSRAFLTKYK